MAFLRTQQLALSPLERPEEPLPLKLDQNECPWDWPEALKLQASESVTRMAFHRYPPATGTELRGDLARRWRLPPSGVVVGNGSHELLQALLLSALGPGRTLLLPSPCLGPFRNMALLMGASVAAVPMAGVAAYDLPAWLDAVEREGPQMILIGSPHDPTGAAFPTEGLQVLLERTRGIVVVNEAYGEFSGRSAASLLPEAQNLAVIRSFSKAWASASLRLGYLLTSEEIAGELEKVLSPYAVSPVTAALGRTVLRFAGIFEARVHEVVRERERILQALGTLPALVAFPSSANFLLIRFRRELAPQVHRRLKERGVLMRDVSGYAGLEGCLRLTVGRPEENDEFLAILEEVLKTITECSGGRAYGHHSFYTHLPPGGDVPMA